MYGPMVSGGACRRLAASPMPRLSGGCRCYVRGVPFTPLGTIQDFTSSPHHTQLARLQRELDQASGREPTGLYDGPTITTPKGARSLLQPQFSDSYQADLRDNAALRDTPEHELAARQRLVAMQSDSYGEAIRGVVSPPPPPDPYAPREYVAPRVHLDDLWWRLMGAFPVCFVLMSWFSK